jgi:hypothetical protein
MSDELAIAVLQHSGPVQEVQPPPAEVLATPTPEQARAADAVFSQKDKESAQVAGLVGMYMGAVMLHNLAVETFQPAVEEPKRLPRRPEEEPDDPDGGATS